MRIQDLCKGGGGKILPTSHAESRWQQKFGPQNWGSGGGGGGTLGVPLDPHLEISILMVKCMRH